MFQVGDKVVHPMHGAGVIDSIVREKISGKAMDFYVFKMPISGLTLKIPTVIKALMHRDSTRGLSNGERKMLHIAKQILVSEIVLAEDVEYPEAEGRVNAAMLLKESD